MWPTLIYEKSVIMVGIIDLVLLLWVLPRAMGGDLFNSPFAVNIDQPAVGASCAADSVLQERRLAAVRNEILAKLRLTHVPVNPTKPHEVDKEAFSAYNLAVRTNDRRNGARRECSSQSDSLYAKQLRLYFPASYERVIPPAELFEWGTVESTAVKRELDVSLFQDYIPPTSYKLAFDMNLTPDLHIWSADLRLYKRKRDFDKLQTKQERNVQNSEKVEVYYISQTRERDGKFARNLALITSNDVTVEDDGYESFGITQAVRRWIMEGSKGELELEVVVRCPQSLTTGLAVLPNVEFVLSSTKTNSTAQLVVALLREQETVESKQKRQLFVNSQYCVDNPSEPNCCLRNLEINFRRDFGWTWIIAPPSFTPNFCQGLCPAFWPSASTSTSLLIRYRQLNPTAAVEPCCATALLKPLTLLLVINGRIMLEELSNMIVEGCVCR